MIKNSFYLPVDGFFPSHSLDNIEKSLLSIIFDSNSIYKIENTDKCESQIVYVVEFMNEDCCEILVQSIDKKNSVELSLFKYKESDKELELLSSMDIDFQPTETLLDSYSFPDISSPILVISSIDSKFCYYSFLNHKIEEYYPKQSPYNLIYSQSSSISPISTLSSASCSSYVVKMQIFKENNKIWLIIGYEDGSLFVVDINENIQYNCIFPGTVSSISICPNISLFMLIVGTIYGEIYECKINNELRIIEYDSIYSKKSCILSLCYYNSQLFIGTFSEKLIILEYNPEEIDNEKKINKISSLIYSYPIMSLKVVEDEMSLFITTLREFYILKLK